MAKILKLKDKLKGQSVIEIIVSVSILIIIASSCIIAVLGSFSTIRLAKEETTASLLASEGLEAVNSIRDQNWENITNGIHGLTNTNGTWAFLGSQETIGKYRRTVTVSDVLRLNGEIVTQGGTADPDTKKIAIAVSWNFNPSRQNTVSLQQYVTNWQTSRSVMPIITPTPTPTGAPTPTPTGAPTPTPTPSSCSSQASCLSVNTSGAALSGGTQLTGITLGNNNPSATITIDKTTVSWTGGTAGSKMTRIRINGITVWNDTVGVNSGSLVDITNTTLGPNSSNIPLDYLLFSKSMTGATFSIQFVMTDTSVKTVSGITP